jgi:hypothetical protein
MNIGLDQELSNIQTSENTQKELHSIKTINEDQPKPNSINQVTLFSSSSSSSTTITPEEQAFISIISNSKSNKFSPNNNTLLYKYRRERQFFCIYFRI